jgi:hypothetical protein
MQGKAGGKVCSWLGIITTNRHPAFNYWNQTGMTQRSVIPVKRFALRQSGDHDHENNFVILDP